MSFVANALGDVGHAIGGIARGLGPIGTAAALGAGLYFGAPYLSSLAAGGAGAAGAGAAATAPYFTEAGITTGSAASDAALGLGSGLGAVGAAAPSFFSEGGITSGSPATDASLGMGSGGAAGLSAAANPGLWGSAAGITPSTYGGTGGIDLSLTGASPQAGWLSQMAHQVGNLPLSSWLSIGGGLYGLTQSQYLQQLAQAQAAQQQRVAGQQNYYAQQLAALQANPSLVTQLPGYQAGLQAVERSQAAGGYLGSGNMMAALQQYGGQAYQNQFSNLAALSGITSPNNFAAQTGSAAAGLTSGALASIGYGASLPQLTALMSRYANP